MASYGSMVLSIATIIGCLMAPWLAERFGRRLAMGLYFVALGVAVAIAFGYVFYQPAALTPFFVLIFFLGIGGANFALYTLWLPEQYSTELPRQRDRLRQLGRPLRRRGDGVSRRHRDSVIRQPRRSRRGHGDRVRVRRCFSCRSRSRHGGRRCPREESGKVQSSKLKSKLRSTIAGLRTSLLNFSTLNFSTFPMPVLELADATVVKATVACSTAST